jgi:muconolactone delta-isomerase
MSMTQFERYVEAYKEVKADGKNFDKLAKLNQTNKYWASARRYSNMLFNFDKNMALSDFSSKMPALLQNIKMEPRAKHYVYSAFFENRGYGGHGIIAVAKELEKMGYTKMTVAEAKRYNKAGKLPDNKKRYVLAITNELNMKGGAPKKQTKKASKAKDDSDNAESKVSASTGVNLHELIKIYNSKENKNGELIHVFLASQGFNEGIDLKGVQHIHIFEPLVTWASDKQTIGRAARYCSHADLDRDNGEWRVQIHRYMSDLPLELKRPSFNNDAAKERQLREQLEYFESGLEMLDKKTQKDEIKDTKAEIANIKRQLKEIEKEMRHKKKLDLENIKNIDEIIYAESRERMKQLLVVYQAMKEAAIDCQILKSFHSSTGNNITCEYYPNNQNKPRNFFNFFDPFAK